MLLLPDPGFSCVVAMNMAHRNGVVYVWPVILWSLPILPSCMCFGGLARGLNDTRCRCCLDALMVSVCGQSGSVAPEMFIALAGPRAAVLASRQRTIVFEGNVLAGAGGHHQLLVWQVRVSLGCLGSMFSFRSGTPPHSQEAHQLFLACFPRLNVTSLGNSQKVGVAWLEREGYSYIEKVGRIACQFRPTISRSSTRNQVKVSEPLQDVQFRN